MDIFPKVVELHKEVLYTVELKSTDHIESIFVVSKNDFLYKEKVEFSAYEYKVFFHHAMEIKGEFFIKIHFSYKESKVFDLYCIDEALVDMIPLKGDLHMHTTYSDGKRSPLGMVLASLEAGMDFIAITDHDNFQGSQEAIAKVQEHAIDIQVFSGEEVSVGAGDTTLSKGNGHMLSINGLYSIDDLRKDKTMYELELKTIADSLDELEENIDPLHYARNIWAIKKIKEAQGFVVLCHPNWIYYDHKYHLHQPLYKQMLLEGNLDAVEVYGDVDGLEECNDLAALGYMQYGQIKYAPIANSDAHDSDHGIGDRFSIVFSRSTDLKEIFSSIKDRYTLAVKKQPNGTFSFIGKSELAHYGNFLLKEYFPKHDKYKNKMAKLYYDQLLNGIDLSYKIETTQKKYQHFNQRFFDKKSVSS